MFQREPGFSPHQNLWQAVLRLAVDDALLGRTDTANVDEAAQAQRVRNAFLEFSGDRS